MQIANPSYDSVFKYLLEDPQVAIKLISLIIGEEIIALDFKPTEHRGEIQHKSSFCVFRLDFAATIRLPEGGQKQVLIEIQKAKLASDIMRFRRYLGQQYSDPNNADASGDPFPLLSIYFLGYPLEQIKTPVIKVTRSYTDNATGQSIPGKDPFIECLTHDSIVIQMRLLKEHRRNLLENVLQIFGQGTQELKQHLLNIEEANYPSEYGDVVRRLQKAVAEPDLRENMTIEDDILQEFSGMEREIEHLRESAEEADIRAQKERQRAEEADIRAEEERQRAHEEKLDIARQLKAAGMEIQKIASMTQLPESEIEVL